MRDEYEIHRMNNNENDRVCVRPGHKFIYSITSLIFLFSMGFFLVALHQYLSPDCYSSCLHTSSADLISARITFSWLGVAV